MPRFLRNLEWLVACKPTRALRISGTLAASALALAVLVRPTQDVVANGETRSLRMVNMHTGEKIDVAYMRQGRYDQEGLKKLNWFLRDWRRNEATRMDPRMLDTVWMAYRQVGAREPINVVCGYRAPATNALLRRRSRGVAKFSQHTLGKAMDYYIPGVNLATLRAAGLRLQRGGVGFYPTSGSPFVHMDAGSVRMWPRMSRQQLAAVFPDGKTVHIPSDGRPMPGYQAAFAELRKGGGSVGGFKGGGEDDAGAPSSGSGFGLASLFGGSSSPSASSSKPESTYAVLMADKRRRSEGAMPSTPQPAAITAAPAAEPAPVVATILARADVPLPERRPAEAEARIAEPTTAEATTAGPATAGPAMAGPRMAWQTGPSGNVSMAFVPLPPSRPGHGSVSADGVQLASMNETGSVVPPPAGGKPQVLAPSSPVMSDVSRSPEALFRRDGTSPAAPALSYAAAELAEPAPTRRNQGLVATRFEDLDFASVSAPLASAVDAAKAGLTRPDLSSVATLIPSPTKVVVIRFGLSAYQDLRPGRFTGAAIRPLKTASILRPSDLTGAIARVD